MPGPGREILAPVAPVAPVDDGDFKGPAGGACGRARVPKGEEAAFDIPPASGKGIEDDEEVVHAGDGLANARQGAGGFRDGPDDGLYPGIEGAGRPVHQDGARSGHAQSRRPAPASATPLRRFKLHDVLPP